jgi:hypothetical protein
MAEYLIIENLTTAVPYLAGLGASEAAAIIAIAEAGKDAEVLHCYVCYGELASENDSW